MEWLVKYLYKTHPTQMTMQCHDAISMYLHSVVKELWIKIENFRDYDAMMLKTEKPKRVKCNFFSR